MTLMVTIPQLRAEEDSARKIGGSDGDDGGRGDKEGLNLKVLNHHDRAETHLSKTDPCDCMQLSHDKKDVNIQTPGPKPHPNWVYRHHFTAEERTEVQRSLSMLQQVPCLRHHQASASVS